MANTTTKRLKKMLLELAESTDNPRVKLECAKLLIILRTETVQKLDSRVANKVDSALAEILDIDRDKPDQPSQPN